MSVRKLWIGIAVGAVGLGSLLWARSKDTTQSSSANAGNTTQGQGGGSDKTGWARARRLASPLDHPKGVVVEGDYAYVVTGGSAKSDNAVLRIGATSGAVETLVKVPQVLSGELALDDKYVYFSSESGNAVLRVSKIGGPAVVVAEAARPIHLALDDTHVYFSSFLKQSPGGALLRVAKSGGSTEVLTEGQAGVDQVVVDAEAAYFRSNSGVWRVSKAGGKAECLLAASPSNNVDRLTADSTHLYFFQEIGSTGKYAIARLPKRGGTPETVAPQANPTARLALSDSHVYYFRAASLNDDALAKVLKAGGSPELVDGAGYSTGYLTVSGGDVYFTDVNSLFRVPK